MDFDLDGTNGGGLQDMFVPEGADEMVGINGLSGMNESVLDQVRGAIDQLSISIGINNFGQPQKPMILHPECAENVYERVMQGTTQLRCDERWLYRALMGYGLLLLFCLAMVGNLLNVIVCHSDQIRFYVAIRMLRIKLYMNCGMMLAMLPQALQIVQLWETGGDLDRLYWQTWPYQAFVIHVFGFCANWLTVLMTTECFLHVFLPTKSRAICTRATLWKCFTAIAFTAVVLGSTYPLNRVVSFPAYCRKFTVLIHASRHGAMGVVEQVQLIANFLLSILSPLVLLVFMSAMISWRLVIFPRYYRRCTPRIQGPKHLQQQQGPPSSTNGSMRYRLRPSLENHFSSEKIGVTRIALITTLIQLITETPSMPVLIYAAIYGPQIVNENGPMCTWQTVSHFFGLTNASLSFFIYIILSSRFRNTLRHRLWKIFYGLSAPVSGVDGQTMGGGFGGGSTVPASPLSAIAHRASSLVQLTARRLTGGGKGGPHRGRVMTIAASPRDLSHHLGVGGGPPLSPTSSTRPLLQLVARTNFSVGNQLQPVAPATTIAPTTRAATSQAPTTTLAPPTTTAAPTTTQPAAITSVNCSGRGMGPDQFAVSGAQILQYRIEAAMNGNASMPGFNEW